MQHTNQPILIVGRTNISLKFKDKMSLLVIPYMSKQPMMARISKENVGELAKFRIPDRLQCPQA